MPRFLPPEVRRLTESIQTILEANREWTRMNAKVVELVDARKVGARPAVGANTFL